MNIFIHFWVFFKNETFNSFKYLMVWFDHKYSLCYLTIDCFQFFVIYKCCYDKYPYRWICSNCFRLHSQVWDYSVYWSAVAVTVLHSKACCVKSQHWSFTLGLSVLVYAGLARRVCFSLWVSWLASGSQLG